jgi:uncharacterized protein
MLFSALLLGLAGSLHCVGMCGPLLLALPVEARDKWAVFSQMLRYHSGRILTYALLGVLFGLAGKGIALAGFQQALSVAASIFIFGMAFMAWRFERLVTALPGFGKWSKTVQQHMGRLLRRHSGRAFFSMGLLNGLLPCGMTYVALAGSLAATTGFDGGFFMAAFGVGTLPLLLSASVLGHTFRGAIRQKIRVVQPILLILAGCLLLQRGLQLDLSFFEAAVPKAGLECHNQ